MPDEVGLSGWRKIKSAWMRFGEKMAEYFGIGLFAVLYVVAFAPMALACRMLGKRFLPHFRGDEKTYYLPKEKIEPTMEYMKRQW